MTLNAYKCQSAVRVYTADQRRYNNTGEGFISPAPAVCSDVNDTRETASRVAAVHMLRSIQAVRTVAAPTQVVTRKYSVTSSINIYRRSDSPSHVLCPTLELQGNHSNYRQ